MPAPGTSPFRLPGDVGPYDPLQPAPQPVRATNAPQEFNRAHPPVRLYLETEPNSNEFALSEWFDWQSLTRGMDGADTTLTIRSLLDASKLSEAGELGEAHFTHLIEKIRPDLRVRIAQNFGASTPAVYFQGYPQAPAISWTERGQAISCTCLSAGQEKLRTGDKQQVIGRRMRWAPLTEWDAENAEAEIEIVQALAPTFNAGGRPNRSREAYPFTIVDVTYRVHLFVEDNAPEAEYWTFVEALRYHVLMSIILGGEPISVHEFLADTEGLVGLVEVEGSEDPFVRRMTARVEEASLASVDADEGIGLLTDAAGLHYEIATRNMATGLAIEVEHYLRVFATLSRDTDATSDPDRSMGVPQVYDLPREAPFTTPGERTPLAIAEANKASQANVTIDRRAINAPIFIGGYRDYEVTLLLRPGWVPQPFLDDLETKEAQKVAKDFWAEEFGQEFEFGGDRVPRSVYHAAHKDHALVSDIGRYWIFPDDFRWVERGGADYTSAYARLNWPAELYMPYDPDNVDQLVLVRTDIGGGVVEAEEWLPRRRPFRDLIGRAVESGNRAPIVRINFDVTDPYTALQADGWVPFAGHPDIDEHRAGVRLTDTDLWAGPPFLIKPEQGRFGEKMLDRYIEGRFMVSATCVVRGDKRMVYRAFPSGASFTRQRHQVIDLGLERFRERNRRGQNSHLNAQPIDPDPEFEDRDDTEKLQAYGDREAALLAMDTVAGSPEVPWFDSTYQPGDSFSGIAGLGIEFNAYPEVVRIEYSKHPDAGYRTALHLTDLRDSPEVGVE